MQRSRSNKHKSLFNVKRNIVVSRKPFINQLVYLKFKDSENPPLEEETWQKAWGAEKKGTTLFQF